MNERMEKNEMEKVEEEGIRGEQKKGGDEEVKRQGEYR